MLLDPGNLGCSLRQSFSPSQLETLCKECCGLSGCLPSSLSFIAQVESKVIVSENLIGLCFYFLVKLKLVVNTTVVSI